MICSRKRLRNRSGFTLVNQVMLLGIVPVVWLAATSWVHESMKMSTRFQHRRESHVAMNYLANQIQDNVRGCKSLELNVDLNQIQLAGHEGQQTTFRIDGSEVQKTITVAGEVMGRENYRLSEEYFVQWDEGAMEDDANRVALNVFRYSTPYRQSAPESLDVPDPKLELVITARANRWNRSISFGRQTEAGGAE